MAKPDQPIRIDFTFPQAVYDELAPDLRSLNDKYQGKITLLDIIPPNAYGDGRFISTFPSLGQAEQFKAEVESLHPDCVIEDAS